jgi:hypothetical protein
MRGIEFFDNENFTAGSTWFCFEKETRETGKKKRKKGKGKFDRRDKKKTPGKKEGKRRGKRKKKIFFYTQMTQQHKNTHTQIHIFFLFLLLLLYSNFLQFFIFG